jgi:hypothetical protein
LKTWKKNIKTNKIIIIIAMHEVWVCDDIDTKGDCRGNVMIIMIEKVHGIDN